MLPQEPKAVPKSIFFSTTIRNLFGNIHGSMGKKWMGVMATSDFHTYSLKFADRTHALWVENVWENVLGRVLGKTLNVVVVLHHF